MGTNEQNEKRSGSEENESEDKQNLKKKTGRKAKWSETMVDDMVDIIVNNE